MRQADRYLNTIMAAFIGCFIGRSAYTYWDFHAHPGLYAMQSGPWYDRVLLHGAVTAFVLAVCLAAKFIIRRAGK